VMRRPVPAHCRAEIDDLLGTHAEWLEDNSRVDVFAACLHWECTSTQLCRVTLARASVCEWAEALLSGKLDRALNTEIRSDLRLYL
jgi:hypothetical protein